MDQDPAKPLDSRAGDVPNLSSERRRLPARAVAAGAVLLMLAGAGIWAACHWRQPGPPLATESPSANHPEDPRLTYAGRFLNIHPDVAYVGDEKCSECHLKTALSFHQHPMGRSLQPISRVAARQRYDGEAHNPFEALGTQFLVERRGEQVVHRQMARDEAGKPIYQSDTPIDYVLGSGTRGYSYLTDRGGYLYQSPVSWFSQKEIWDKSPGFGVQARAGRPVSGMCLFCHANRAQPREEYINRYEEPVFNGYSIGCERCHGPGGQHVKNPGLKDPVTGADYSIVNPRHLRPELRAAVCEQCHLTGEARVVHRGRGLYDFRPGLPLANFLSIYVQAAVPDQDQKAVNHVEQMYLSRCFLRSEERPADGKRKLGCTSCHDPHRQVGPGERVAYYRERCLKCHQERGCSVLEATRLLKTKNDSCIDCHMPRYPPADIAHTAATDHRIVRSSVKDAHTPHTERGEKRSRREPGIIPFYPKGLEPDDKEGERDLGIALAHIMVKSLAQRRAPLTETGQQAVRLLETAVRNDPADMKAREALAEVLALLNRREEALTAYENVLSLSPHREASLMGAAMLAQNQQQPGPALAYWRRAVAENPWQPYYRESLARILTDQKAWNEARPHCEAWFRLDPASMEARVLWVRCLAKCGDKARARDEFAKIERLRPPNLPLLQARFAVELRSR